jgi:hypothetical protein
MQDPKQDPDPGKVGSGSECKKIIRILRIRNADYSLEWGGGGVQSQK